MSRTPRARLRWLRSAGLLAALAAGGISVAACEDGREAAPPPNILFVFTDDHAAHAVGAYGSAINRTPHLDRLAREGMLFRNAFVTNAICAPSRAVLLTGKHSHLNGVFTNRERFDSTQVTFPGLLRQAGYETALIGKWHLKSAPAGFDHWEVLPGQGTYYNPDFITPEGRIAHTGYTTDIITDKVIGWLRNRRDPERPFLLMYQHKAPHRNWLPGPRHLTLYADTTIPEPATLFDDYAGRTSAAKAQEMTIAGHLWEGFDLKLPGGRSWDMNVEQTDEVQLQRLLAAYAEENDAYAGLEGEARVRWKYQRYIKDYLRSVAAVDDNLGRVLDYLDASGLADNTVVVYSSDQGFFLGDHGWFDKRWMYEESLRMPLIVRWPGVTAPGSENRDLVQNLDFAPTFLDLAGVAVPSDMQGRSLEPLLRGETPDDWREAVYYHYFEYPGWHMVRRHYGARTQRYKLIYYYEIDEWELFDLEKDPDELRSVYDDPAYAEVVVQLKVQLEALRQRYRVPARDPVPYPEDAAF